MICIASSFTACEPEAEVSEDDIVGVWEVVYAERNGKHTELVEGATFAIERDSTMTTDITGVEESGAYEISEGVLHHHASEPLSYHISQVHRDSVTMRVDIRGLKFKLDMVRQDPE